MSPTGRETIINRRLSGAEARALIAADFETLLANEGLLSHFVAYGRIAWDIELRLHVENPLSPDPPPSRIESHAESQDGVKLAVEAPPLADPNESAVIAASTISRSVESPNAERLRTGLPVSLDVRQQDGTTSQQRVEYPVDATQGSEAVVTDTSEAARAGWRKRLEEAKARADAAAQQAAKASAASE